MTDWTHRLVKTETLSVEQLLQMAHPENAREHPEHQLEATEELIETIGLIDEIKVNLNTNRIINGHARIQIALQSGQTSLPVNWYDLTEDEERLALEQYDATTYEATYNPDKLRALMKKTQVIKADRPALQSLMARLKERAGVSENGEGAKEDAGPQIDKAEQLQEKWQVKPGDIWQIGQHRLICGDCRDIEVVKAVCDGQQVNGVFTSPPYAEQRKKQYGGVPTDEYVEWWEAVQGNVRGVLAEDGSFFVNIKPHCEDRQRVLYVFDLVLAMARRWGWRLVDESCWSHQGFPGKPQNRFQNAFEPIYLFCVNSVIKFRPDNVAYYSDSVIQYESGLNIRQRQRATGELTPMNQVKYAEGKAYPRNVLNVSAGTASQSTHAAAFPLALPTFFIKAYSDPDDIWLDPFAGSGTTILAAHKEGRIGFGIELLPKYCSVILERLTNEGIEAERLIHQDPVLFSE